MTRYDAVEAASGLSSWRAAASVPLRDASVEVVWMSTVVHHVRDLLRSLSAEEFEAGRARLAQADAVETGLVVDHLDLLVLRPEKNAVSAGPVL